MRLGLALVLVAAAAIAAPETKLTRCQVELKPVDGEFRDYHLLGCGEGFADNILWHLDRSDSLSGMLDERVTRGTTGKGAIVFVLDTGIQQSHSEFERAEGSSIIAGFEPPEAESFCPGEISLNPCWGAGQGPLFLMTHGTAVASMIAGRTVGVAPDAKIVSVVTAFSDIAGWAAVLDQVVTMAFDPRMPPFRTAIVNISGGVPISVQPNAYAAVEAKIRRMIAGVDANGEPDPNGKTFLFVSAAGNTAPPRSDRNLGQCDPAGHVRMFPALAAREIDGLISVGGIGRTNELWSGSCHGSRLEVFAPAEKVLVASITGRDHFRGPPGDSGTSYATPYISGIAARLLELDPTLTAVELESRIRSLPSFVTTRDEKTGEGRVPVLPPVGARRRP